MSGWTIERKRKLLKAFLWIAVFDLVLGLILAVAVATRVTSPAALRGAFLLLVVGAFGVFWYRSASGRFLRQESR